METVTLGPRTSFRGSPAWRGLIFGAAAGIVGGLWFLIEYLIVGVMAGVITGPLRAMITGAPTAADDVSILFAVFSALIGATIGLPLTTTAGAAAGFGIGVLPGPRSLGRCRAWSWLTGTLVNGMVAALVLVTVAAAGYSELLWSDGFALLVWCPVLIFVLAGGPFAVWLRDGFRPQGSGGPRRHDRG